MKTNQNRLASFLGVLTLVAALSLVASEAVAQSENPACARYRSAWGALQNSTDPAAISRFERTIPPSLCPALHSEVRDRLAALEVVYGSSKPAPSAPGFSGSKTTGGTTRGLGSASSRMTASILARGYVLAPDGAVPEDAVAYAIIVFNRRQEAERFCPTFRDQLNFEGALRFDTDLSRESYRRPTEIAPVIWPVTAWPAGASSECANLTASYDYAGARSWLRSASSEIQRLNPSAPQLDATAGPYIVIAHRRGGVIVYDLTRAPDNDYARWLRKTIEGIEGARQYKAASVVTPGVRDQLRFWAFGVSRDADDALATFVPGYAKARALR